MPLLEAKLAGGMLSLMMRRVPAQVGAAWVAGLGAFTLQRLCALQVKGTTAGAGELDIGHRPWPWGHGLMPPPERPEERRRSLSRPAGRGEKVDEGLRQEIERLREENAALRQVLEGDPGLLSHCKGGFKGSSNWCGA